MQKRHSSACLVGGIIWLIAAVPAAAQYEVPDPGSVIDLSPTVSMLRSTQPRPATEQARQESGRGSASSPGLAAEKEAGRSPITADDQRKARRH